LPGNAPLPSFYRNMRILANYPFPDAEALVETACVFARRFAHDQRFAKAVSAPLPDHDWTSARLICSISMQATTIDAEIERLGSGIPRLIKIDTEGAEHRVLAGARTLLTDRKVPFIIAELHEFGLEKMNSSQQALRQFMEGFGYSTFGLYFDGALPKLIPAGSHLVAPHIINILFSTPEELGKRWPTVPFDPAARVQPRQ